MEQGQRDLVLAPNEYAFIQDATKGGINVYVGPHKTSLAGTDKPVAFDYVEKKFVNCSLTNCILNFTTAPEGWYVVLKNPGEGQKNPKVGTANSSTDLQIGRKVNIPGPTNFALWPGQMSKVVQGHQLKSNQYLVVRIYDDEAAKENWGSAILRTKGDEADLVTSDAPADIAIGKLYIIKGTSVSFYIPPTGVEVVQDDRRNYVRDAVTLERLEYCILLDENGEKRFVRGPDVVFPEPTEQFIRKDNCRKFRAIELNDNSGIYVKVIAAYEEDGVKHKAGDELFIKGSEQRLYYPRAEHAIIKYGDETVQFGIAVPSGDGRYVLDRLSGAIMLEEGPKVLLPDPRYQVLVRRVLSEGQVRLWYPGNEEALALNRHLSEQDQSGTGFVTTRGGLSRNKSINQLMASTSYAGNAVSDASGGDEFNRRQTYTPQPSITMDNKYEGAVSINVWPGYAIQLVNKKGEREVVEGPKCVLLKYEEDLTALSLSSGKPKSTDRKIDTVYLKTKGNKISDIITVETADMVEVDVKVSLRVNFEGDDSKWFDVDNYVKLLTDHIRSLLKCKVKTTSIQDFYSDNINLVRDTILKGENRTLEFEENGMVVYDVEVLSTHIKNREIAYLLEQAQSDAVSDGLTLMTLENQLVTTKRKEEIERDLANEVAETKLAKLAADETVAKAKQESELLRIQETADRELKSLEGEVSRIEMAEAITDSNIENENKRAKAKLEQNAGKLEQFGRKLQMQSEAAKARGEAISPQIVAALQAFGDKHLMERLVESLGTLAIANGSSVTTEMQRLLNNSPSAAGVESFINSLAINNLSKTEEVTE